MALTELCGKPSRVVQISRTKWRSELACFMFGRVSDAIVAAGLSITNPIIVQRWSKKRRIKYSARWDFVISSIVCWQNGRCNACFGRIQIRSRRVNLVTFQTILIRETGERLMVKAYAAKSATSGLAGMPSSDAR